MTGPEHYAEAERLLAVAQDEEAKIPGQVNALLACAEVHRGLAQVAATVELFVLAGHLNAETSERSMQAWREAIGL